MSLFSKNVIHWFCIECVVVCIDSVYNGCRPPSPLSPCPSQVLQKLGLPTGADVKIEPGEEGGANVPSTPTASDASMASDEVVILSSYLLCFLTFPCDFFKMVDLIYFHKAAQSIATVPVDFHSLR